MDATAGVGFDEALLLEEEISVEASVNDSMLCLAVLRPATLPLRPQQWHFLQDFYVFRQAFA